MQDMRADDQIVFVKGQRPIRCGRAMFFRRKEMKALVGVSRFKRNPRRPGSRKPLNPAGCRQRMRAVSVSRVQRQVQRVDPLNKTAAWPE